ncbi:type II CAAX endopeptidase family protein [Nevskia soli]|uniref:type II CAAX endopeptidase family protein n=1 Tax=Nevskia soli TaxID=418856 RepID=UPI0015D6A887|nr:type II CAAX endopeptidase family protein [Nevskia soli]
MTPSEDNVKVDVEVEPVPPKRFPFWNWQDAALLLGLGLPCLFVAALIMRGIAALLHVHSDTPAVLVSAQAIGYAGLFAVLAGILRLGYDAPFWRSLGWVHSRLPAASAVILGSVLSIAIAVLGGLLRVQAKDSEMQKLLSEPGGAIALALFAVTLAPLAEELFFRGFLQPLFVRTAGVIAGIGITGALFGALHFQEYGNSWGSAVLVSVAGIAFGVIRHLSGSTQSSVLAHVGYNGTLFALFFAVGRNLKT